jgi:hypothetical protein
MRAKLSLLTIAGLLMLTAACSIPGLSGARANGGSKGDGKSSKTASRHDPCCLVTREEVATALEVKIVDAIADANDCNYHSESDGPTVAQISWSHGDAEAGMTGVRAGTKIIGMQSRIEGLGDEAILMPPAMLWVRQGDDLITVNLVLAPQPLDKARPLAQKALSRL